MHQEYTCSLAAFKPQIDKNLAQIRKNTKTEKWEEVMIRPFYNGNQYFLFVTETFASVTIAPDWSATRMTMVDVFVDWAVAEGVDARTHATARITN